MADIFISYAKTNRDQAQILAAALEAVGWIVWWDRNLPAGQDFDEVIERELDAANCVIVLWSNESISSPYVKGEAREARDQKKLLPVFIADVKPPMDFRALQGEILSGWDGSGTTPAFLKMVKDLERFLGPAPVPSQQEEHVEDKVEVELGTQNENQLEAKTSLEKTKKEDTVRDEKAARDRQVTERTRLSRGILKRLRYGFIGAAVGATFLAIVTAIEIQITSFTGTKWVLAAAAMVGAIGGLVVGAISGTNWKLLGSAFIGGVIGWICSNFWFLGEDAMLTGQLGLGGSIGAIVGSIVGVFAQNMGWID